MDVAALQTRQLKFSGKETTCGHRQYLLRKLAWHLQAKAKGELPESAIELARSIAQDTPLRARMLTNAERRRVGMPMENPSTTTIEPAHDARTPLPGWLIVNQYRVNTYVVTVRDNGFEYEGCPFPSLSTFAFEITRTKDHVHQVEWLPPFWPNQ